MRSMTLVVWLALCGAVIGLAACGDDGGCIEGETQPCTCAGGDDEAQICEADGTWGECGCDGDTDTDADIPHCVQTCEVPADCVDSTSTYPVLTDEDNHDCSAEGFCVDTGCNSTEECQTAYSSDLYGCTDQSGFGSTPRCVHVCDTEADCDQGTPPYSADNYWCTTGGFCRYTGCNDGECEEMLAGYVCAGTAGYDIDVCQQSCGDPGDCGTGAPAYNEDNYDCVNNVCVYTGCNSEEECVDSYYSDWTCNDEG